MTPAKEGDGPQSNDEGEGVTVVFDPDAVAGGDQKDYEVDRPSCWPIKCNCDCCPYISPKNHLVRAWENFVILTIFLSCIVEILMASFSSGLWPLWFVAYFCDAVYLFDICKQFLQAYEVNGILIRNQENTMRIYGKRTFIIDLLSILPSAIILPFVPANQAWDLMAKVRLNRVLRFYRIFSFFNVREAELGSNTSKMRTLKYFIVCCVMTHCVSCGWYGMACQVADRENNTRICATDSWVYNFDIGLNVTDANLGDMYVVAFYFAMATATSTGYGDISGSTYPEKWFSIVAMLVGIAVFFGMLLGGMTSLLTNLGAQRAQFAHRLGTIQHHMQEEGTSLDLRSTVMRFYEYTWYRKKGVSSEGMFDPLPITFQEEIALAINQRIIDKAPIFRDLDVGFIRQLSMRIKPALCLPHQFLVNRGDIGQQMYYIHRGEVEILAEDDDTVMAKLAKGRIIGEINLVHSLPRTASIRAATHCDLMVLERGDVHELLPHYPDVAKRLHDVANDRIFNAKPMLQFNIREKLDRKMEKKRKHIENITQVTTDQMQSISEEPGPSSLSIQSHDASRVPDTPSGPVTDHGVHSILERRTSLQYDENQVSTLVRRSSTVTEDGLEIFDSGRSNVLMGMDTLEEEDDSDLSGMIQVHKPPAIRRCTNSIKGFFTDLGTRLINPKVKGFKNWEITVALMAVLIFIYNTFMACFAGFNETAGYGSPTAGGVFIVIGYLMDMVLLADVIVTSRTAVYTPNGVMKDGRSIMRHYAKGYLIVDVASVIPIEAFCLIAQTSQQKWILFAFLKLNRLIKMAKVAGLLEKLEDSLDQNIISVRRAKCIVFISLLSHVLACVWFLSACSGDSCRSSTWVTHVTPDIYSGENTTAPIPIGMRYVQSLYWAAATMTSTGYGDIYAYTTLGRIICIFAMIIGLLLYGYCLAIIAATLANLDSPKVNYQAKLFAVKDFMIENKMNEQVIAKVIEYLVRLFYTTRGEFIPGGRPLLYDMPHGLQLDIVNDDAISLLGDIPLFRYLEESFLRMLALKAKRYLFTPGDIIIYSGEVGQEMYIIKKGYCEVLSANLKYRYAELGPGEYFGELGVLYSGKRTATVRTLTYCYALMVTRVDLEELFEIYPNIASEFKGLVVDSKVKQNENRLLQIREDRLKQQKDAGVSVVRSIVDIIESDDALTKKEKGKKSSEAKTEMESNIKESVKVFKKKENGVLNKEYLKPFSLLNLFQKILALCLMRWTFLPTGKWLKAWTTFRVLLAIVIACMVPIHIAFLQQSIIMWVIVYICDLICLLDMYINFHVAFYNENNLLVTHPISTAKNYVKTNFLVDLLSILPIELFIYAAFPYLDESTVQLFALGRINRLIQVYRIPMAFNFLESRIEAETGTFRKIKFAFYTVIFIIILNCCLFMMACPPDYFIAPGVDFEKTASGHKCRAQSWLTLSGYDDEDGSNFLSRSGYNLTQIDVSTLFVISIYWSTATTVSVGYGDINATETDIIEMIVCVLVMIMGVVFFGYIIASVAASMANADAQRARFQRKLEMITKFLKDQNINDELTERVISYYEYVWIRTKGVDPDTLFDGLPLCLWGDVTYSLYREIISKVALFEGTEVSFQKMLSRCIKPMLYQKGDYIVRKFDIGSEMFFINRGVVDVVSEDGSIVFASMKAGAFFGEVALLFTCPRTASIRAQTNVDMFVLSRTDLDSVLNFYPEIKKQVYTVAEERRSAAAAREKKGIDKPKAKTIQKKTGTPKQSIASNSSKSQGGSGTSSTAKENSEKQDKKEQSKAKGENKGKTIASSGAAVSQPKSKAAESKTASSEAAVTKAEASEVAKSQAESSEAAKSQAESSETPKSQAESTEAAKSQAESTEAAKSKAESTEAAKSQAESSEAAKSQAESSEVAKSQAESGEAAVAEVESSEGAVVQAESSEAAKSQAESSEAAVAEAAESQACSGGIPENNTNQNAGDSDKKEGTKEGEEQSEPKPGRCRSLMQRLDKMNRFTINPAGRFMKYFNIVTTVAAIIIGWTIAFQAAYQDHHPAIMVLNYLAEVIFLAQIYVNFHLSFRDNYGDLVEDFQAVYMNYLKTPRGFALDFIATFPLDIFALAAPAMSQYKVLSYLRIIHLLHLYHPFSWLNKWEKELDADVLTVRLLRSFLELGLLLHYFASIWYGISCPGDVCSPVQSYKSWTSTVSADYHLRDTSQKYCDSVYWAVATLTSTGYGDFSAHNILEMLYACIVMICGKLLFGFVLGNIAATLANAEAQRTEYDNKLTAITAHLHDQEVPTSLRHRVVDYFDYLWIRNQGVEPKGLFRDAPYTILSEITLEMSMDMFTKINILENAEDAFFRQLAEKINIALYMPGDSIIKKGDLNHGLSYIYKGEVEIVHETDFDEKTDTIQEKEIFGEEYLVHERMSEVTLRARTHVDLFTLSKKDLDEVLENYPELRVQVNELGHEMFGIPIQDNNGDKK